MGALSYKPKKENIKKLKQFLSKLKDNGSINE
jgi:hypothetical protein